MKNSLRKSWPILAALVLTPSLALAHPGHGPATGLANGLAHPLTGMDHLCAMIAVGLWAAQRGGKALWAVPLTFVSMMTLGAIIGMGGHPLPFVEQGIAASVLILGILIAAAIRLPVAASAILVGLFALFHGYAHGAEMPGTASGLLYGFGICDFNRQPASPWHRFGIVGAKAGRKKPGALCGRRDCRVRLVSGDGRVSQT